MIKASFYAGIYTKNTFEIAQTGGEKEVWKGSQQNKNLFFPRLIMRPLLPHLSDLTW